MRWVLAFVFALIGGIVGAVALDESFGEDGTLNLGYAFIGMIIAAPVGYLIGALPMFSSKPEPPPPPVNPRAPNVVGQPCVICDERILLLSDGVTCPQCYAVFHVACNHNNQCPSCGYDTSIPPVRG